MPTQIPISLLKYLASLNDEFGLSYRQMSAWLYDKYEIKITPQGLRKALLRDLPEYEHKKEGLQNVNSDL